MLTTTIKSWSYLILIKLCNIGITEFISVGQKWNMKYAIDFTKSWSWDSHPRSSNFKSHVFPTLQHCKTLLVRKIFPNLEIMLSPEGTWEPRQECEVSLGVWLNDHVWTFSLIRMSCSQTYGIRDLTSYKKDGGFWARENSKRNLRKSQSECEDQVRL